MTKLSGTYYNKEEFTYYSKRYNKRITVLFDEKSDGASGAFDIDSDSWWVHDTAKKYQVWDDGSKITNWQASFVIYDLLLKEDYYIRARTWFITTLAWGSIVKKNPLAKIPENLHKYN